MTRELTFGRRAAASGNPRSLVVFLHGYGADGNDLLGLADPLAMHLPDTVFIAPNAPEDCTANPFGYQWFPIPSMGGSTVAEAEAGLARAAEDLNAFLDARMAEEGMTLAQTALVGFSQGTMMALHVAPRRAAPVAAVVGFSGRLLHPETFAAEMVCAPPTQLIHGDQDPLVPLAAMREATTVMMEAGVEVHSHVSRGTAHGIAPDGLALALSFLKDHIPG
ncbi:MAG: dienelactone hydrolase family protein [Rhodobacteraceae bacterium]|nr:dienelactone hydrolase family protein [Paracoccaceae bacterium]